MIENPIGKCRKHGKLDLNTGILCEDKESKKGYRLRCKTCIHENRVNYYYRNRDEAIKYSKDWKEDNRDKVNESARKNYHKDIDETRIKEASRKKKLNLELYKKMVEDCDNKCHICNNKETRLGRSGEVSKNLSIDHCHASGKIRGLLCHACNTMIGKAKEDINILQKAIQYLQKHQKEQDGKHTAQ